MSKRKHAVKLEHVERKVLRFPTHPVQLPESERVVGLALSGGGSHGAFTAGIFHTVYSAYLDEGRLPKLRVVSGTSTGSLVGGLIAEMYGRYKTKDDPKKALEKLEKLYTDVHQDEIALVPDSALGTIWNLITKHGVADISPLQKTIEHNLVPELIEAATRGPDPTEYVATITDMVIGKPRGFSSARREDMALMGQVIFASCAQPVVMTPAYVNPVEGLDIWATDGGVREVIPFREAMRPKTTHICAVALNEISIDEDKAMTRTGDTNPLDQIDRGLSVMNDEVARDDERMARTVAYINRARDRLRAHGVDEATIAKALPYGEMLPTRGEPADPDHHDPNDDSIYDESKLREILFFRFKTQDLPSSMIFEPSAMLPLWKQGVALASEHMAEIRSFLEAGGMLAPAS
ncbi:MAG TPA: patatin-like phospholipase family protein [Polyangiaceae bacterium]|jgi:predicted acylesterase/phospholipase RssA|nr:patatin-like phospholipase family protein [Polyangiaceae bacterium]